MSETVVILWERVYPRIGRACSAQIANHLQQGLQHRS